MRFAVAALVIACAGCAAAHQDTSCGHACEPCCDGSRCIDGLSWCIAGQCAAGVACDGGQMPLDAVASADAATSDAGPDASGTCAVSAPAQVRFEPALSMPLTSVPARLLGHEPDAASNGLRLHLDLCPVTGGCPTDLVVSNVGDALARVHVPPGGADGTLAIDASRGETIHLNFSDPACGGCGFGLDLLAGTLVSGVDPSIAIDDGALQCSTSCAEVRGVELHFTTAFFSLSVGAEASGPTDVGEGHARIASDLFLPCAQCDCATAPTPATGIVFMALGYFEFGR